MDKVIITNPSTTGNSKEDVQEGVFSVCTETCMGGGHITCFSYWQLCIVWVQAFEMQKQLRFQRLF